MRRLCQNAQKGNNSKYIHHSNLQNDSLSILKKADETGVISTEK